MKLTDPTHRLTSGKLMTGVVAGFRLETNDEEKYHVKSYKWLEENKKKIPDGTTYSTYICGTKYKAIRDSSIAFQANKSMGRQMTEWLEAVSRHKIVYGRKKLYGSLQ